MAVLLRRRTSHFELAVRGAHPTDLAGADAFVGCALRSKVLRV